MPKSSCGDTAFDYHHPALVPRVNTYEQGFDHIINMVIQDIVAEYPNEEMGYVKYCGAKQEHLLPSVKVELDQLRDVIVGLNVNYRLRHPVRYPFKLAWTSLLRNHCERADMWRNILKVAIMGLVIAKDSYEIGVTKEMRHIIVKKHRDYGPNNILVFGELGVLVRSYDKYARLENLLRNNQSACVAESVVDTWLDLANYAVIALMLCYGYYTLPMGEEV